jgi:hypothetical protein
MYTLRNARLCVKIQLEKGGAFQEILSVDLAEDELRTAQNL